jgi:hypothetical protein
MNLIFIALMMSVCGLAAVGILDANNTVLIQRAYADCPRGWFESGDFCCHSEGATNACRMFH